MTSFSSLENIHHNLFGPAEYHVHAPGRINLIGEHTDYNHGFVLPAATDRGIHFLFNFGSNLDAYELYSKNLDSRQTFHKTSPPLSSQNWAKYLQALIKVIKKDEGISVPYFQASLTSEIPVGGGLSSSAALTTGFLTAIHHHLNLNWTIEKIASLAQKTEHLIGAKVGIMDPYSILAGKTNHFVFIDCRTNTHRLIPGQFDEYTLLLADTGISHDLASSEYNQRRETCESILKEIQQFRQIDFVSDITFQDLDSIRSIFPDTSIQKVEFVIEENQRVLNSVDAIRKNDWSKVGSLMYESHDGLSKKYQVSCKELDFLIGLAKTSGLVTGARMMGGGFGGSTINLLKKNHLTDFQKLVKEKYQVAFGKIPRFTQVRPSEGVTISDL